MRYFLLPLSLSLLACFGPLSPDDSGGGLFDRPGNGGGPSVLAGPCPAYAGLDEGIDHRFAYTPAWEEESGQTATWNHTVVSHEDWADGDVLVTVEQQTVLEGAGFSDYVSTWTGTYGCDDEGAWLLSSESTYSYRYNGGELLEGWYDVEYEDYLSMTWAPEEGWTNAWSSVQTDSNGNTTPHSATTTVTFEGEAEVETPAGSFNTLMLAQSGDDWSSTSYYDEDAGWVMSETSWITRL